MFLMDKRVKNDKSHENYIISLKVNKNSKEIMYEDTCDRNNDHMDEESINDILSPDAESSIKKFIEDNLYVVFTPKDIDVNKAIHYSQEIYSADYIGEKLKLETLKDLSTNILIDKIANLIRKFTKINEITNDIEVNIPDKDIISLVANFKEFLSVIENLLDKKSFVNIVTNVMLNIFENFREIESFTRTAKVLMISFENIFLDIINDLLDILKSSKHPKYFNFLSAILTVLNNSPELKGLTKDVLFIINKENLISNITSSAFVNSNPIHFNNLMTTYFMLLSFVESNKEDSQQLNKSILSFNSVDEDLLINSKSFSSFLENNVSEILKLGSSFTPSRIHGLNYKKILNSNDHKVLHNISLFLVSNKRKMLEKLHQMSETLPDFSFDTFKIDYNNIFTAINHITPFNASFNADFNLLKYLKDN